MWTWIERLGAVAGILGLVFATYALFRVGKVEDLIAKAEGWKTLDLALTAPSPNSEVTGHILEFEGRVFFESHAPARVQPIRLQLLDHEVELLPLIRPISEPLRWWPQPVPSVSDDGVVTGAVRVGEEESISAPVAFEAVLLAIPKGAIARTETYESLPPHFAQSNVVRVVRVQ